MSVCALLVASLALTAAWVHVPSSRPRARLAALPSDLGALTVPELKEELKSRGLRVGGVKRELIARLTESESAAPPERISLDDIEAWLSDTDAPDVGAAGGFSEAGAEAAAAPSLAPDSEHSRAAEIDEWLAEATPTLRQSAQMSKTATGRPGSSSVASTSVARPSGALARYSLRSNRK